MFMCIYVLFKSFVEIKIEFESRLHCVDIYNDDRMLEAEELT